MRDEYSSWYIMDLIHGLKIFILGDKNWFDFWDDLLFIILIKSAGMVGFAEINGKQKWGAGA